jgi:hypothetical protein
VVAVEGIQCVIQPYKYFTNSNKSIQVIKAITRQEHDIVVVVEGTLLNNTSISLTVIKAYK